MSQKLQGCVRISVSDTTNVFRSGCSRQLSVHNEKCFYRDQQVNISTDQGLRTHRYKTFDPTEKTKSSYCAFVLQIYWQETVLYSDLLLVTSKTDLVTISYCLILTCFKYIHFQLLSVNWRPKLNKNLFNTDSYNVVR